MAAGGLLGLGHAWARAPAPRILGLALSALCVTTAWGGGGSGAVRPSPRRRVLRWRRGRWRASWPTTTGDWLQAVL